MPTARPIASALIAAAVCAAACAGEREAARLPCTVPVVRDHAYLRAGPSDDFYPTERLVRGDTLEVWAIDPAGFCAVRPVTGSFSWMRADDITDSSVFRDTDDGGRIPTGRFTGVVVTDGAVSRVGSQLNDLRHVAQVRLEAGERVQVLETVTIDAGRHAGHWARIEPPSGEYRWARATDLGLPPELAPPPPVAPPSETETAAAAAEATAAIREAGDAVARVIATAGEAAPRASGESRPSTDAAPPQPLGAVPMAKRLFAGWLPLGSGVLDPTTPAAPVAVSTATVAASAHELADIDLSLSLAVAGPSDAWNLEPLRERLRLAAARTTTQEERLRAEAIDARLSRFESIQSRQRAIASGGGSDPSPLRLGSMWSSLSTIGSRPIRPGVLPGGAPADGQPTWTPPEAMEATGRLATVVSRRPDAPRWAVVDESNNVVAFVTPSPGVNLAPLVGQQVAVRGAKGYMPEYKRPYMVASEARPRLAATPPAANDAIRQ
ncbi:MAG: hypothetical protein ACKOEX_09060 [Planctomycetia bacterium]